MRSWKKYDNNDILFFQQVTRGSKHPEVKATPKHDYPKENHVLSKGGIYFTSSMVEEEPGSFRPVNEDKKQKTLRHLGILRMLRLKEHQRRKASMLRKIEQARSTKEEECPTAKVDKEVKEVKGAATRGSRDEVHELIMALVSSALGEDAVIKKRYWKRKCYVYLTECG